MDYTYAIPASYGGRDALRDALEKALPFLDADAVYLTPMKGLHEGCFLLTVLILQHRSRVNLVRDEIARMAFGSLPMLRYQIFNFEEAAMKPFARNFFFIDLYVNARPLCYHEHSMDLFFSKLDNGVSIYGTASIRFQHHRKKAGELSAGSKWFFENGHYQLAAHLIHPLLQLLFGICEGIFDGKETVAEGFLMRQERLNCYRPGLCNVFDGNTKAGEQLSWKLQDSYRGYPQHDIAFSRKAITGLITRTDLFREAVRMLCDEMLSTLSSAE